MDLWERRNFDSTIVTSVGKVSERFRIRSVNNSNWYDTITTYLKTVFPTLPMSKYLSHPSAKHAGCLSELLWKLYDEVERIWHSPLSSAAPYIIAPKALIFGRASFRYVRPSSVRPSVRPSVRLSVRILFWDLKNVDFRIWYAFRASWKRLKITLFSERKVRKWTVFGMFFGACQNDQTHLSLVKTHNFNEISSKFLLFTSDIWRWMGWLIHFAPQKGVPK